MMNSVKIKCHTVIIGMIIACCLFYANLSFPDGMRAYYKKTYSPLKVRNGEEFEHAIRNAVYGLIESESWGGKPFTGKTFCSYLFRNKISPYAYGEYGYLLHYAFLYAQNRNDLPLKKLIKNKFDKYFRSGEGIIVRCDQVAYGNVAIDLYVETGAVQYKDIASQFYTYLDSISDASGLILYREGSEEQHVDAIGLVCPFLFYYAETFNISHAKELARQMAEDYVRWGVDPVTGIPCQTYDIRNHIKKNHSNWGRGISWYLMGTRCLIPTDTLIKDRLDLLDSTLSIVSGHLYSQYFAEKDLPDMSATIPVLYHLCDRGYLHLSKDKLAVLLSPYIDSKGIIRYCSPSISYPHVGVNVWTSNLFCQGLLLYLLSEMS